MALPRVDSASIEEARDLLRRACGSTQWVDRMLARRPFETLEALLGAARAEWFALGAADWLQAFADHPRIGDRESLGRKFPETHDLASREQAGVADAGDDVLTALAEGNVAYEDKFGYIFIVCATGLDAETMLAMLRERLDNDPWTELRIAAEEQAKITALRLAAATVSPPSSGP
jgi:2-oxo-4-hydroxy-4-carboxy-5-ureidoimidazoline decarboxylase